MENDIIFLYENLILDYIILVILTWRLSFVL